MKNLLMLALLLGLLGMGCLASPSRDHMCSDGTIVLDESKCPEYNPEIINLNPDDFESITLEKDEMNFVKSGGIITTTISLKHDESGWLSVSTFGATTYYRHKLFFLEPNSKHGSVELIRVGPDMYSLNLTILIPGKYTIGLTKRNQTVQTHLGSYNLTVIGEVSNESMAYSIAEMFMIANTPDQFNCPFICIAPSYPNIISFSPYRHTQNWNVTTENAVLREDGNWEVFMEASYDWCGIDWDEDICLRNNTITGHFIINKKTGQIIG